MKLTLLISIITTNKKDPQVFVNPFQLNLSFSFLTVQAYLAQGAKLPQ